MQVTEESVNGLERTIKIQVPSTDIDTAVQKKLQSLAKEVRINGFRPGKVPLQVVKKRFGGQVRQEVLGDVINESYHNALTQENYRPAGMPAIEPVKMEDDSEEFAYTATFEVYPEIELASLSGATVTKTECEVGDADLDEMMETLRTQRKVWNDVDRAAQTGDQVIMDFTGSIDGEEFPGGAAKEAPLELGSNSMIPGFEDQLIGVSKGDQKTISVNFPEDYRATELAGKEAQFEITVHGVKVSELPEVNDDFAKEFGVEEGGVDGLRADIRKNMERELKQAVENRDKQAVMDLLLEKNDFPVPGSLVKDEIGRLKKQLIDQMQVPEGSEPELEDEMFTSDAERRVKLGLLVAEIIRKNEMKPDPDKVRSTIESMAASYEDPQQVVDYYYGNQEYMQNIEGLVLEQQVTDWAMAEATVQSEAKSFKEVMNPDKQNQSE